MRIVGWAVVDEESRVDGGREEEGSVRDVVEREERV